MKAVSARSRVSLSQGDLVHDDPAFGNRLSLYSVVPAIDISLSEFEAYGDQRLSALREIDVALSTGQKGEALNNTLHHVVERYLPLRRGNPEDVRKVRTLHAAKLLTHANHKDVLSHFILRLAFCSTQQDRQWFINNEVQLLKYRLTSTGENVPEFLALNGMDYKPIDERDHEPLRDELAVVYNLRDLDNRANLFYRVPFLDAVMLLKGRRVFLQNGFAILHESKLVEIVAVHFKTSLSQALATTVKAHAQFSQDERLQPLLSKWSKGYLTSAASFRSTGGVIDMSKIDQLADLHYPLCMKHQHRALRVNHHLMHTARMQYGLFLKGIGVTLDDSINFWKNEFMRRPDIDEKTFNSRYAYTIRHNYGKEGKRMDYNPYGCAKIINQVPGVNEHHGCPFRNSKREELMQDMQAAGIGPVGCADVLKLLEGHHYQIACKKYFELTHPNCKSEESSGTIHPNSYFADSVRYWKEQSGAKDKEEAPATQPAATAGRSSQLAPPQ